MTGSCLGMSPPSSLIVTEKGNGDDDKYRMHILERHIVTRALCLFLDTYHHRGRRIPQNHHLVPWLGGQLARGKRESTKLSYAYKKLTQDDGRMRGWGRRQTNIVGKRLDFVLAEPVKFDCKCIAQLCSVVSSRRYMQLII